MFGVTIKGAVFDNKVKLLRLLSLMIAWVWFAGIAYAVSLNDIMNRVNSVRDKSPVASSQSYLTLDNVKQEIKHKLIRKYGSFIQVTFYNNGVNLNACNEFAIAAIEYTDDNNFKAFINLVRHASKESIIITGRVDKLVSVPVLKEDISKGRVIQTADLEFVNIRQDDLQTSALLNIEDIVGKCAKCRLLKAGALIKNKDLAPNYIVHKGDIVTITYKANNLVITNKGKACSSAIKGGLLKVMLHNKRQIDCVVIDKNRAEVTTF